MLHISLALIWLQIIKTRWHVHYFLIKKLNSWRVDLTTNEEKSCKNAVRENCKMEKNTEENWGEDATQKKMETQIYFRFELKMHKKKKKENSNEPDAELAFQVISLQTLLPVHCVRCAAFHLGRAFIWLSHSAISERFMWRKMKSRYFWTFSLLSFHCAL